ncbi:MAG: DUF748 domain-containing protein, partial [Burkholderiales bacterium]|nr:DUF748 domain-containing protein [Burkholderiales bacterium]
MSPIDPPPTTPVSAARRRPALQHLIRAAGWVAVIWLLLAMAAAALPGLLRGVAEREASSVLGREVRIEHLSFNPFTLSAQVEGLVVSSLEPAAPPLLQVDRVAANLSLASLWQRAPVLDALQIEHPRLALARLGDNRYSIDDLLERFARPSDPGAGPLRWALYNLSVSNGEVELDDRPAQRVHRITAVDLGLPVLSNLDAQDVAIQVEPRLRLRLNGTEVDTGAQARPFAQDRAGELSLDLSGLDLADWQPYWPAALPVRLRAGRLHTAVRLRFSAPEGAAPSLSLQGRIGVHDAQLVSARGEALLDWRQLNLDLVDVQPLKRRVHLGRLEWADAHWHLQRDATGRLAGWTTGAPQAAGQASASDDWVLRLDQLQWSGHSLDWRDASTRPAAHLPMQGIELSVRNLRWPFADAAMEVDASMTMPSAAGSGAQGRGRAQATLKPSGSTLRVQLSDVALVLARPYLGALLAPRLDGRLGLDAVAQWSGLPTDVPSRLEVTNARLDELRLSDGAQRLAGWSALELGPVQIDTARRTVRVEQLNWQSPHLRLFRDASGRLNAQDWLLASTDDETASQAPWAVTLERAQIRAGQLQWRDAAIGGEPVALSIDGIAVQLGSLRWPASAGAPAQVTGELRLAGLDEPPARADRRAGRLRWDGRLSLAPALAWQGQIQAQQWPAHLLAPYAAADWPVTLARAALDGQGSIDAQLRDEGLALAVSGQARVSDLRLLGAPGTPSARDELLSWRELVLDALEWRSAPGQAPSLALGKLALSDFYASLVVTEQGRLNLNDLQTQADPAAPAATPDTGVSSALTVPAAANAPALQLVLGGIELRNGRVDFADRYIRPNYSAAISELQGTIGAYRWDRDELAPVALAGRLAGTGQLDVRGRIKPTAQPLVLDIQARATDLELTPLSPYAAKYAGYAIERGKLSMDLRYQVQPDGRLEARNQIVLNQLTFGDKVDSPDATRLPVLLAVALLKDRNGVIDLNLPVGGSINDPEFSVGGLVLKLILNLLGKALTAPFALLSGSGGGEDLGQLAFEPGTSRLAPQADDALVKVARALTERPALQLTITGVVDPSRERMAWQAAALEQR